MNPNKIDDFFEQNQWFKPVDFERPRYIDDAKTLAAILNDYKRLRSQAPADEVREQRRWERYCLHIDSGWPEVESACKADVELDIYYGEGDIYGRAFTDLWLLATELRDIVARDYTDADGNVRGNLSGLLADADSIIGERKGGGDE